MKAKLLKQFRKQFYYSFGKETVTLVDRRQCIEYLFSTNQPMTLKLFIANWKWGISRHRIAWKNERKREINVLKRKFKHLNL